jgi:cilia- and flagella-associated protein 57
VTCLELGASRTLQVYREFSVKQCRTVSFSNGGQHFAAVNGTLLQIYSTYTCENIGTLRGHSGKISTLFWSKDDTRIISAGKDGAVYEWRMNDFKREKEHVVKGCQYTSVIQTADHFTMLATGSDCMIKELEEHASAGTQVKQEIGTGDVLTNIHLTKVRFTCPQPRGPAVMAPLSFL